MVSSGLSVLTCTYKRHELLRIASRSVTCEAEEKRAQAVVANGGDERAHLVAEGLMGKTDAKVKLVKTVNKNLVASQNAGLHHSTGVIIRLRDADGRVCPDWVTQMKRGHPEHPEAGAAASSRPSPIGCQGSVVSRSQGSWRGTTQNTSDREG